MVRILFISVVLAGFGLAVYLYFYLGGYKPVDIAVEKRGPQILLYKNHVGAYHEIGPTIQAVESWALAQHLLCPTTFGEYLDNPESVDQDRLRSRGGCVLTKKPEQVPPDWTVEERPSRRFVVAHFTGSPSIGPFKVYPKVKKYLAENRLTSSEATMELYMVNGSSVMTEYLFQLAQ